MSDTLIFSLSNASGSRMKNVGRHTMQATQGSQNIPGSVSAQVGVTPTNGNTVASGQMPSANRYQSILRSHLSFGGAVLSEFCKARSITSTYVLLILNTVLLCMNAGFAAWAFTFFSSQIQTESLLWAAVGNGLSNGLLVATIFGVMFITTEYSTGSMVSSLTANPHRVMFVNAKACVAACLTFVSSLIGLLIAWGISVLVFGSTVPDPSQPLGVAPWTTILGGPVALAFGAVMALGLGGLCRSTVGGIFAAFGLLMIVPSVLQIGAIAGEKFAWTQSIANILPSAAMTTFTNGGNAAAEFTGIVTSDAVYTPSWWVAGLIYIAWCIGLYTIGVLMVRNRDVK